MGVSVRALAESAVASGYNIVGLDAFGDWDLQTMCECYSLRRDFHHRFSANGLYKASRRLSFDAVVYTANLENYPDIVGRLAKNSLVLGNSKEVLMRVRHWPSLYSILKKEGFRSPITLYELEERQMETSQKWLIKPMHGGGGHQMSFWRAGKKLRQGSMLQEYYSGISCSASFVSNGVEAVVIGMTEQLTGLPEFGGREFTYCGNLLPLIYAEDNADTSQILDQIQRIANLLTREFNLVGVNGMDFIINEGQVYLLEVNPRYSSSMELIERAYHLPIFDLHMRAISKGELPDFDIAKKTVNPERFYGKAILYAEEDGQAPRTETWIERDIRDVPHPGETLFRGKPICTVLADGTTRNDCYAKLVAQVDKLKGEIYG
ncbi:MAG TPA: ATP-grasp domain-containing protein [Anaerolineaceae bacterium]|nr:ATP-grasp domain-containing protein [Anaerolineaceae bacterium]